MKRMETSKDSLRLVSEKSLYHFEKFPHPKHRLSVRYTRWYYNGQLSSICLRIPHMALECRNKLGGEGYVLLEGVIPALEAARVKYDNATTYFGPAMNQWEKKVPIKAVLKDGRVTYMKRDGSPFSATKDGFCVALPCVSFCRWF